MSRRWQLQLVVLLALTAVALGKKDVGGTGRVMTLTSDTFDSAIASNPLILVEFYAPWCVHCQQLAPEYERAAAELASHDPPLPLAIVDVTEEPRLASRYEVINYPTLKVFHDGVSYDYDGPRHASGKRSGHAAADEFSLRNTIIEHSAASMKSMDFIGYSKFLLWRQLDGCSMTRHFLFVKAIVEFMKEQASPEWRPPPNEVLVLTADNFTHTVNNAELILVEFYAPWCEHCKTLEPEYKKAAIDLKEHGILLAKVDATVEKDLASQHGIDGYPTMKLFRKGREYEYEGTRKHHGIVKYMLQQSGPASTLLHNKRELEQFWLEHIDPVVIAFPSSESDRLLTDFMEVADKGRGGPLGFAHSFSEELAKTYGAKMGTVSIFKPQMLQSRYEPAVSTFKGRLGGNVSEALQRVLEAARPLVGLRDLENQDWYNSYPLLAAYLEMDRTGEGKNIQYWRNRLLGVAAAFHGRIKVVMSDEEAFRREVNVLGFGDSGEDVVVGLWGSDRERYAFSGDIEEEELMEFVEAYFAGDLTPHVHSQPRPRRNDGPVTVVVGSTFQEVVFNPKADVLVEFYAPWSEPCKTLEPKYRELAKKYKKNKKLVIAKFDATANDSPTTFEYSDFPSIFFVGAQDGKVVKYEGEMKERDITRFLERKATYALGKKEKKAQHKKEEL